MEEKGKSEKNIYFFLKVGELRRGYINRNSTEKRSFTKDQVTPDVTGS